MLISLGYSGVNVRDLVTVVKRDNLIICDLRMSPRSRAPQWNKGAMSQMFGKHYLHVPALGNRTYHSTAINYVDLQSGVATVRRFMEQSSGVVLLCACGDARTCHRTPVGAHLAELTGAPLHLWTPAHVTHLAHLDVPQQLSLFGDTHDQPVTIRSVADAAVKLGIDHDTLRAALKD